jgi:nucleoside-diphosphate-sugar epimerase
MVNVIVTGAKGFIGKNLANTIRRMSSYFVIEINEDIFDDSDWDENL